jgi:hydrogenase/urease accessory protein HupE
LLLFALWPDTAAAHGALPGMEGFYWGMLHPFSAAPQLLLLLALALFIQQRLPEAEDAFIGLLAGSILGAAAAALGFAGFKPDLSLTVLAILVGLLVVGAVKLGSALLWTAGGVAGLLNGHASWPDPGPLSDMLFSGLGAVVGSVLIVIAVGSSIELIRQKAGWTWLGTAVRVAGSWIVAISVLLGALLIRSGG